MNFRLIVETIFKMEEELDLFNKTIGGIYFWELIRFNVVNQIAQQVGIYNQAHTKLERDPRYIGNYVLNAIKNIVQKNPFLAPKSDILFFGHPRRKKMEDGLWWDIYCDPVIDYIQGDYTTLLLEKPYLNTHLFPAKTRQICYLDLLLFLCALQKKLKIVRFSLTKDDQIKVNYIQRAFQGRFGVLLELERIVSEKLLARKCLLPLYTQILKNSSPKAVVVLVSYDNEILIEACHKLSIPVVEFQHGTISRYHTAYSFPGHVSKKKTFPDYFFAFGDFWKNLVDFPIPKERIYSVGYPFFEMETAKYSHQEKSNQIIFVSQGTIGKAMSQFAAELAKHEDFTWRIIYKLHPGEYDRWKEKYPWLTEADIEVMDDDSVPLYKLLAQSIALIGVYSTVVYEGLGKGLKTFLIDLPGIESMDELIATGAVTKVASVDELITALKKPQTKPVPAEQFFKPNSLENISNALEEIFTPLCQEAYTLYPKKLISNFDA